MRKINNLYWFFNLIYPFYSFLVYFLLSVEIFTFKNSVSKFLYFGAETISYPLILMSFLILLSEVFIKNKTYEFNHIVNYFYKLLLIPLFISYYFMVYLEENNFKNYVFSKYHLNIDILLFLLSLNCILVLLNSKFIKDLLIIKVKALFLLYKKGEIKISLLIIRIVFIYAIINIFFIFINNFLAVTYNETIKSMLAIKVPYENRICIRLGGKKCNESFGWIQVYGDFIKRHSDENSTIYIPPQKESWEMTGNIDFFRYFIYPRNLISNQNIISEIPSEADYVLISYGEWYSSIHTWPQIIISKDKIDNISIIDRYKLTEEIITNEDYLPNFDKEIWGIIKIKK